MLKHISAQWQLQQMQHHRFLFRHKQARSTQLYKSMVLLTPQQAGSI